MRKRIYLDNAASAPLNRKVLRELHKFGRLQGNPQGENGEAHWSFNKLQWARWQVACAIGCNEDEVFFCSGSTEANMLAKQMWRIKSDKKAHDSLYAKNSNPDVFAVSYINNETGKYDGAGVPYHRVFLDLTATIGHVNINLHQYPQVVGAAFSGHKFGALQGVGVLYIKEAEQKKIRKDLLPKSPWSFNGGTPNTLGIYLLGVAIKDACNEKKMWKRNIKVGRMGAYISDACTDMGLRAEFSSHIVNITFKNVNGSLMTSVLAGKGIDISVGSACHSGGSEDIPSKILLEEGYTEDEALRTVRVSLSYQNTMRECRKFIKTLQSVIDNYDSL